jgi:coenzyme F420-0:L-glutamate ligase / coenzyme F420-1:gamma-L-glutamate ligase
LAARTITITGLEGIPEIRKGDPIAPLILEALKRARPESSGEMENSCPFVEPGCIFVVAQKIVSKSEGRVLDLSHVVPSEQAHSWAEKHKRDPRMVEIVLRQAKSIVRMDRGILIVETQQGFICANAGVDASNAPQGSVILLPEDPDLSAAQLQKELQSALGVQLGVIISDTFGRPWRQGLSNVALGVAGIAPLIDYRGQLDSFGRPLQATVLAAADELAAAAELIMGKTLGIPVALIEGFKAGAGQGTGRELIRPENEDLFR